MDEGDEKTEN